MELTQRIKESVRDVKDYPKPGILFKDITPVLSDPALVKDIVGELSMPFKDERVDAIAAVEARGFIFGSLLAYALGCAFVPVRKSGKLPHQTMSEEYELEYGYAAIEMHVDAFSKGSRVLIHDDLLATGGTAGAAAKLVKSMGGELAGFSFLINLAFLPGEENLKDRFGISPHCLIRY
jgi:adenine phosphoribosyltransferase